MIKTKLNFLHVCDYASFDQNGKLNILGIFENINSPKFPHIHPQFFVVANISVQKPGEYEYVLRIADSENNEISKFTLPKVKLGLVKDKQDNIIAIVGQFLGARFAQPGIYRVEVVADGELIDYKEIKVSQLATRNA